MKESDIQEKVTTFAESVGLIPIRINVAGRKGWPDYGYLYKGRICFIEFKVPGESPDPLQRYVHGILTDKAKCYVFVIDDIDEGCMKLRHWKGMLDVNG